MYANTLKIEKERKKKQQRNSFINSIVFDLFKRKREMKKCTHFKHDNIQKNHFVSRCDSAIINAVNDEIEALFKPKTVSFFI